MIDKSTSRGCLFFFSSFYFLSRRSSAARYSLNALGRFHEIHNVYEAACAASLRSHEAHRIFLVLSLYLGFLKVC